MFALRTSVVCIFILLLDFAICKKVIKQQKRKPVQYSSIEYYTKQNHDLNIKVLVHLDPSLTRKLAEEYKLKTRRKLKNEVSNIIKDVERYFKHPSLNHTVHFKLLDTKFLKNTSRKLDVDENVTKYLKSYCNWQARMKVYKRQWYLSILLTGLDVFYIDSKGHEVRKSQGRGYMGGMCNMYKSCTLIEWYPHNMGYLLAHEIGHSLGLPHDGPPANQCKAGSHIMSPKFRAGIKSWSPCSARSLKQYLESGKSWCLKH